MEKYGVGVGAAILAVGDAVPVHQLERVVGVVPSVQQVLAAAVALAGFSCCLPERTKT